MSRDVIHKRIHWQEKEKESKRIRNGNNVNDTTSMKVMLQRQDNRETMKCQTSPSRCCPSLVIVLSFSLYVTCFVFLFLLVCFLHCPSFLLLLLFMCPLVVTENGDKKATCSHSHRKRRHQVTQQHQTIDRVDGFSSYFSLISCRHKSIWRRPFLSS